MKNETKEIDRLIRLLINAGICPDCEGEITHFMSEPFADCECMSYGEWTSEPPTICKLRYEIAELKSQLQIQVAIDSKPQ